MKKFITYFGTGIIVLLVVLLLASLLTENEFAIERNIEIDQPVDVVFDYVRSLQNQYNYSVWGSLDPDMRREYRGTDGAVGFVSAWQGNNDVGTGEQEIIAIEEGRRIDTELRFMEPFESTSYSFFTTESISENRTMVTWGMHGKFNRPMNLMLSPNRDLMKSIPEKILLLLDPLLPDIPDLSQYLLKWKAHFSMRI